MDDVKLNEYVVYVKLIAIGETPEDALDYISTALDASDLLEQDGVIGIELLEDTIELTEDGDGDNGEDTSIGY